MEPNKDDLHQPAGQGGGRLQSLHGSGGSTTRARRRRTKNQQKRRRKAGEHISTSHQASC